jgi:AsmA protein
VTADPETLKKVAVNTRYSGSASSLALSNMTLDLDETKATGSFSVANFEQPAIKFNLNVDRLNADRYLPPRAEDGQARPATPETAAGAAAGLPVEMLQKLDMQGDLAIGQLTLNKAKFNNVRLTINAKAGQIGIAPVTADLYQGKYQGAVQMDATGSVPVLDFDTALAGVQIEPLLTDISQKEAKLTGIGNITAKLRARGADADAIKRTLNGNAEFMLRDGKYKGVNLGQILRQANAILQGQTLGAVPGEAETDFTELTGTLVFKDGVVTNDDLSALSPAIRVAGQGQANLVTDKVDYTIQASVARTAEGQTGRGLEEVGGYTVPVRCTGTLAEPGCSPDFGGLAKARIEREVDKQREKVEEKVKEQLDEKLGDELKKLLPF